MQEYILELSTYNQGQTIKVELTKDEAELMDDITASLEKQNASIMLTIRKVKKPKTKVK